MVFGAVQSYSGCCEDCSSFLQGVPVSLGLAGVDLQHRNTGCIAHLSIHLGQLGCCEEHQNLHVALKPFEPSHVLATETTLPHVMVLSKTTQS